MSMTSLLKQKKINFISLGCAKNLVDSEKLMGSLKASGYKVVFESPENDCDIVIVNTCGFINDAKEESVDTILQNAELKKKGYIKTLIVMGCLSERYKNELKNEIIEIDAVFGVNNFEAIKHYLNAQSAEKIIQRTVTTLPHYAYLKIAEGCNRTCAFCIIPQIRGKHVSVPIEKVVEEARFLAHNGVKELIVIAQDTTYYGVDIYKKRALALLLKELVKIEGIEWIRLHYTYPATFPADVLKLMAGEPKICNYIDIPLQHISNEVLKSMNRGIDKEKTFKLIEKIRKTIPNVNIRTSFIVGYPTETENDFRDLYDFVEAMKFDRVGVFKYSHEENTPAFILKDKVSQKIKDKRYNILMELQQQISSENNKKKIDQKMTVLIDAFNDGSFSGRTESDSPEIDNEVIITTKRNLKIGSFYTAKIIDADAYTLYGVI